MSGLDIDDSVIVVTGASSGIGRATALTLAERGASLILSARSAAVLEEVVRDCEARGAAATAVEADVARREDVEEIARHAVERFGGFDGWVNGAAVMAYGSFWDIPMDSYRRVVEVNLFGTVHGARTAIDHFLERGSGVLVNVSSLYGRITTPFVNPYVVSKHAVRGLTNSLRQEMAELSDVDVAGVYPQAVDTPIFRQAANYTGRELTALPLTIDPQRVAHVIVQCLQRPRSEVIVGWFGHVLAVGRALLPRVYERVAPYAMERLAFRDAESPESDGNVFAPQPELNAIDGGWREERHTLRRLSAAAAALTVGATVPAVARSLLRRAR